MQIPNFTDCTYIDFDKLEVVPGMVDHFNVGAWLLAKSNLEEGMCVPITLSFTRILHYRARQAMKSHNQIRKLSQNVQWCEESESG